MLTERVVKGSVHVPVAVEVHATTTTTRPTSSAVAR